MPLRLLLALSFLLLVAWATPASSAIIQLAASVDGAQAAAGAGTGSAGTGSMSITLDDVTGDMSWSGSFSGLGSPFLVAHFHGPALTNQNGGVIFGTSVTTGGGGTSGTSAGNATLTAPQIADLTGGLWYWNVHSTGFPGGELRGNIVVVPEPGTGLLLSLGVTALALRRRSG